MTGASEATGDVTGASEATGDVTGASEATGSSSPNPSRFPASLRWTIVFIVVMVALVVAIWPRGDENPFGGSTGEPTVQATGARATDAQVNDATLAKARADAALAGCPETGLPAAAGAVLAGVSAPCLATGDTYDLGVGTAGKPLLVNMWAVWCEPCRRELPELAEFAERAGDKIDVLTVHAQEGANNPYLVLTFLTELGVRLPAVLDTKGQVAAALTAPRVFPSTILVRADGTIAKVLPEVFESPDEIADVVRTHLGVSV